MKQRLQLKVTNAPTWHYKECKNDLEELLSQDLEKVSTTPEGFLVTCANVEQQKLLMALDGVAIEGSALSISRHSALMSAEDILNWVAMKLDTREQLAFEKGPVKPPNPSNTSQT